MSAQVQPLGDRPGRAVTCLDELIASVAYNKAGGRAGRPDSGGKDPPLQTSPRPPGIKQLKLLWPKNLCLLDINHPWPIREEFLYHACGDALGDVFFADDGLDFNDVHCFT